jgi:hypothetical protein
MGIGYYYFVRDWKTKTPKFVIKEVCNVDLPALRRSYGCKPFGLFLNEKRHNTHAPQRTDRKPYTYYLELTDGTNLTGLFEVGKSPTATLCYGYADSTTKDKATNPLIAGYGRYVVILDNNKRGIELFAFQSGNIGNIAKEFGRGKYKKLIEYCRRSCQLYQMPTLQTTMDFCNEQHSENGDRKQSNNE